MRDNRRDKENFGAEKLLASDFLAYEIFGTTQIYKGGRKMSRKLISTLKKVDDLFNQMQEKKIRVSVEKEKEKAIAAAILKGKSKEEVEEIENSFIEKSYADLTIKAYSKEIKSFLKTIHEKHGIADVKKIEEKHIQEYINAYKERYKNGDMSASYSGKKFLAAIESFQLGSKKTNVFKKKEMLSFNVDEERKRFKEEKIIRHSNSSKTLRATPKEVNSVLERIENEGYQTETRKLAFQTSKLSSLTGGRITSIVRLKPKDIDFNNKTVTFYDDKGGLDHSLKVSDETIEFLKELTEGKNENQRIFVSKRKNGTFKSVEQTTKEIERVVSKCSDHLTRIEKIKLLGKKEPVEVEKKFTFHSFRKSFALARAKYYYDKLDSPQSIEKYISEIEKDEKIKIKLEKERMRINEDRKIPRDLTRDEYSIFLTSLDLGHFRNNVIRQFYVNMDEVHKYYK